MPLAEKDKSVAIQAAHGFGIEDKDIICVQDWTIAEIEQTVNGIKQDFKRLAKNGQESFLFVYCVGHGVTIESHANEK